MATGVIRRDRVLFQRTESGQFYIGFGRRAVLLQRLAEADDVLKSGFDPTQPRNEDGRWTAGAEGDNSSAVANGGSSHPAASSAGMAIPASAVGFGEGTLVLPTIPSIFGAIGLVTATALEAFGAVLDAPVVAFGAWFIPLKNGAAGTANLPGDPDVYYHYDEDARKFSVYTSDHEVLFEGSIDGEGIIRTEDGQVIGRHVDGSLIIDTTKLPLDQARQESVSAVGAAVQTRAETDTQDKPCPDPLPDVPGFRSARSLAYQGFINAIVNPVAPLPPTLAVYLLNPLSGRPVAFDNCYEDTGVMVDAKGPGYAKLLDNKFTRFFVGLKFLKQAERQVNAAGNRPIIWYVDEPETASYLRSLFSRPEFAEKGLGRITISDKSMPAEMRKYLIRFDDDVVDLFDI